MPGSDHRVTLDFEQEHRVVADEVDRKRNDLLDVLGGEDRGAGRDPTQTPGRRASGRRPG